ncbi:hypothetical protein GE09DRAFT_333673 [Coniochaeta sp. 2T2.1]|nr:hypothetical protein GE09DRAFT_333673 [Coniochaeta sp. 2T2.1]
MERDTFKDDAADTLATRPNGRATAPFVINRNGSRKDLFGGRSHQSNKATNGSQARSGSASLSPDPKHSSPGSRIPRLNSRPPRPLGIKEAYRMAEEADEKEAAQGSPSPAPRTWRSKLESGGKGDKSPSEGQGSRRRPTTGRLYNALSNRRDTASSADSLGADNHEGNDSDSDIDQKIKEFGKEQQHREGASNGLYAKSGLGPKVADTGRELSRKASNSSLDETAPSAGYRPWGLKAGNTAGFLKRTLSSPEKRDDNPRARASSDHATNSDPTPNKSFAWEADADFTAADLLVSDSPPVKTGRPNSPPTYRNKIDEIRALELEAALKYPDEPSEPSNRNDSSGHRRRSGNSETHSPSDRPIGRTNTKLDEIRAREIESLSKRAVATARLDEIRERNAEARSRSTSPEIPRKSSRDVLRESLLLDDKSSNARSDAPQKGPERISDTPAAVLRESSPEVIKDDVGKEERCAGGRAASRYAQREPVSRVDSHDLLRRLARATSTSPAPEQQNKKKDTKKIPDPSDEPEKDDLVRNPRKERNGEKAPKAVGFAGLRQESSAESLLGGKSKRSSLALSDSDPTERIEREIELFAPMDNHSERGSVRAPSPAESDLEEDVEETPRPVTIDPLTQPTPKVTGAYVETPATVKPGRPASPLPEIVESSQEGTDPGPLPLGTTRGREVEISLRKPFQTLSTEGLRGSAPAKSHSRTFQRSKSLPRARSPLINSVRPPTVKDDLIEIQRTYNIEDSTLDDFDGMFAQDMAADDQDSTPIKIEITEIRESLTDQKNAKVVNRIGRSLESIRTARKGIERLEDEFSKAEEASHHKTTVLKTEMAHPQYNTHPDHISSTCPVCLAQPSSNMVAYVHVPLPRLWRRNPTFRFTLLGLIVSALSLWYVAETTMCAFYCKPLYCYPGKPCQWSHDDPFWGYAIPVKLDLWTTGGQGRALVQKVRPEVQDWVADVWDGITGTDIRTVDTRAYNWEQRRQHRRRMRKKGFVKPFVERPEDKEKYEAWGRARIAKEEADARREMGYPDYDDGETMAADERVR